MAESKNVLLHGMSGRIGDLIVYHYHGKTYVRSMPEKGSIELTPEMKEQQERWAGVAAFYQAVKAAGLYAAWKKAAEGTGLTGYNLFVREHQMVFNREGYAADMSRLTVTVGRVGLPDGMRVAECDGETAVVEWRNEERYPDAEEEDRLAVVLVRQEKDEGWRVEVPAIGDWQRKHCRAIIRLPTEWAGVEQMYCFFQSESGEVSRSRYFYLNH